jgi:hypothetical protein
MEKGKERKGKERKGKERKGNNTTLCPPARARVFRLQAGMYVCGMERWWGEVC